MVQEVGYSILKERGIELIATDSPTSFLDDPIRRGRIGFFVLL
jgi:hypothetical protein